MNTLFHENYSGAVISKDKKYRYRLWRIWDADKPKVLWIMHNPSTADEANDDPTIRRVIGFSKSWGYGGIYVGNLIPYRATNPKDLLGKPISELCPIENIVHTNKIAQKCSLHILAYGNPVVDGIAPILAHTDDRWHWLKLTKSGNPCHPLYLPKHLKPFRFKTNATNNHIFPVVPGLSS